MSDRVTESARWQEVKTLVKPKGDLNLICHESQGPLKTFGPSNGQKGPFALIWSLYRITNSLLNVGNFTLPGPFVSFGQSFTKD